jgi:hypothetical protein
MSDQSKSYLQELINLNKKVLVACAYQKLTVDGTVKSLTVPNGVKYAELKLESLDTGIASRHLLLGSSGTQPTTTDGIGLNSLDVIDIVGYQNLINFRITRVQSGITILHVQYYK